MAVKKKMGQQGKESFLVELGRRLEDLREERARRLTPAAVATDGASRGLPMPSARSIHAWEKAEKEPGIASLSDYLAYYGTSLSAFLWWTIEEDRDDARRVAQFQKCLSDPDQRRALFAILDSFSN